VKKGSYEIIYMYTLKGKRYNALDISLNTIPEISEYRASDSAT